MDPAYKLIRLEEVGSTNDYLKALALQEGAAPLAVLARRQTAGKGRRGRSFASAEGGMYLSFMTEPAAPYLITCRTAVCVAEAVEEICGFSPKIKWTNDLRIDGKKLSGMLCESVYRGMENLCCVMGVGVNLNQVLADFPPELQDAVCSVQMHTGRSTDPEALAWAVLRRMAAPYTPKGVLAAYRARCENIGQPVAYFKGERLMQGLCQGIGDQGELLVELLDGKVEKIFFGEVSLQAF